MKTKNLLFVTASLLLTAGCTSRTSTSLPDMISLKETTSSKESTGGVYSQKESDGMSASSKKALFVHYLATNHINAVADMIAGHLETPTFQLTPVTPYTSADLNYSSSNSRVSEEHNDPNGHTELVSTASPDFATAD